MDDMQYVNTQSRHRRRSLDLPNSEYEIDISHQSLPNTINNNREEVTAEYKDKLEKLNLELQIANTEIEALNIENSALKKELSVAKHKIDMFKSVGASELIKKNKSLASPPKFYSPQYRKRYRSYGIIKGLTRTSSKEIDLDAMGRKRNDSNNLSYFFEQPLTPERDLQNTIINHQPSYRQLVERINIDMGTIVDAETVGTLSVNILEHNLRIPSNSNNNIKTNTGKSKLTARKHQVKIFADQSGLDMRSMLQELLGNSFQVTSIVKPGAPMAEVISSCVESCRDFTHSDFILILGGSNDSNPLLFQSILYYTLDLVKNTNILVGKLYNNRYLNVNMLNNSLKLISNNLKNVTFLPLDCDHTDTKLTLKYANKMQASRLIHREILHLKYKIDYSNYIRVKTYEQKSYINAYSQTQNETPSEPFKPVTVSIGTQTNSDDEKNTFFRS